MSESITLYECNNPGCSLNRSGDPGHFTGGITADQLHVLTGSPVETLTEGVDFGESFCPNCGKQGIAVGEHEFLPQGNDPNQDLHDSIAAKVADTSHPLTAALAQGAFLEAVAGNEN